MDETTFVYKSKLVCITETPYGQFEVRIDRNLLKQTFATSEAASWAAQRLLSSGRI